MSDLLGAAGVLLTVVGILFGVWYSECQAVLEKEVHPLYLNNASLQNKLRATLWSRAGPLAISAALCFLVFVPEFVAIVSDAIGCFFSDPSEAFRSYSAVKTAFCLVCLLTGGIAVLSMVLVIQLLCRVRAIESTKKQPTQTR